MFKNNGIKENDNIRRDEEIDKRQKNENDVERKEING